MRKSSEVLDCINRSTKGAEKATGKLLRMQNALQATAKSFNKNIADGEDKDVIFAQLAELQNSLIFLSKGEQATLKGINDIDAVSLSANQKVAAFDAAVKLRLNHGGGDLDDWAKLSVKALKAIEIEGGRRI